jgi:hypothetical protein
MQRAFHAGHDVRLEQGVERPPGRARMTPGRTALDLDPAFGVRETLAR